MVPTRGRRAVAAVLADASALIALGNPSDSLHGVAEREFRRLQEAGGHMAVFERGCLARS